MRIKYFEDTDTMLIEFSDRDVAETIEISENFYAEVDEEGRVVALTFEHASQYADFSEFSISPIILGKKERSARI
jgi:uncharacterized protein YuzE